jgi:hypothetical protein
MLALACATAAAGAAFAQEQPATPRTIPAPLTQAEEEQAQGPAAEEEWIDHVHHDVYDMVWKSAMHVDRWFGSQQPPEAYQGAQGSMTPALLWDQFRGFQPKLRFRVDMPLPQINERFNAFIGRVDRDEYISERNPDSGALQRTDRPTSQDQTLVGISYRTSPMQGGRFDAGAGVRLQFPLDPYVKGSYVYQLGTSLTGLLSVRETVFWQNSERAGVTNRVDLERFFLREAWLLRWSTATSISERSQGIYGYSAVTALRGLPNRRSLVFEVGLNGESDAPVPVQEFGFKTAYRQAVMRTWLVMEVRSSLTWPKDLPEQPRKPSWGIGLGFEMFFGTEQFLARPSTF